MSRRTLLWLTFAVSGAIAYGLVFHESVWPLGRIIAGWYSIFTIVVILGAAIITFSIKWGPLRSDSHFVDFFSLW